MPEHLTSKGMSDHVTIDDIRKAADTLQKNSYKPSEFVLFVTDDEFRHVCDNYVTEFIDENTVYWPSVRTTVMRNKRPTPDFVVPKRHALDKTNSSI